MSWDGTLITFSLISKSLPKAVSYFPRDVPKCFQVDTNSGRIEKKKSQRAILFVDHILSLFVGAI